MPVSSWIADERQQYSTKPLLLTTTATGSSADSAYRMAVAVMEVTQRSESCSMAGNPWPASRSALVKSTLGMSRLEANRSASRSQGSPEMQGRVHLGGALSGRDIEAVNKTVSGMIKLLFPDPEMEITDKDMEAILRMALESRRRVKEQQKRCLKSEFRNTHFSYTIGTEGVEQFVSTPELHSDEAIESDPLPPGQVWVISPGTTEAGPGLYRIEVAGGPGNGVRILNTRSEE